jgi:hypothetical protein
MEHSRIMILIVITPRNRALPNVEAKELTNLAPKASGVHVTYIPLPQKWEGGMAPSLLVLDNTYDI